MNSVPIGVLGSDLRYLTLQWRMTPRPILRQEIAQLLGNHGRDRMFTSAPDETMGSINYPHSS